MKKSKKQSEALKRSMENMMALEDMDEPSSFDFFIQKSSTEAIQRSIDSLSVDLSETDEGGSFHVGMDLPAESLAPKKEVRFQSQVLYCRKSQSVEDKEGYWFSKQEITKFRKREKLLQTQMTTRSASPTRDSRDDEIDSQKYSLIGLNSETERKERLQRIRESRECVTEEQLNQEENFFSQNANLESFQLDHQAISDFYLAYSTIASKVAQKRGRLVSSHVQSLWEEELDDNKSTDTIDIDSDLDSDCSQDSCNRNLRTPHTKRRSSRQFVLESAGVIARLAPPVA